MTLHRSTNRRARNIITSTQCKFGRAENAIRILYNINLLHVINVSLKTGLDPAGVIFYTDMHKGCVMNPTVAHFTDVFYTNRGAFSTIQNVGDLNIYANSGTSPQPGCSNAQGLHGNLIWHILTF